MISSALFHFIIPTIYSAHTLFCIQADSSCEKLSFGQKCIMNTATDKVSQNLNCSNLEARNLCPRIKNFADAMIKLRGLYSVKLYDQSWKIKDELEAFPRPPIGKSHTIFQKAALVRIRSKIRGDLKAMWEAVVMAISLEQELFYALEMYDLPIHKDDYITALLEALNEAGQISDSAAVSDGREIYDNLAPQFRVIRELGFEPSIHETIQSEYFGLRTRK